MNARIMLKNAKEEKKKKRPTISVDAARLLRCCCCAYLVMLVLAREECVAIPGDVQSKIQNSSSSEPAGYVIESMQNNTDSSSKIYSDEEGGFLGDVGVEDLEVWMLMLAAAVAGPTGLLYKNPRRRTKCYRGRGYKKDTFIRTETRLY